MSVSTKPKTAAERLQELENAVSDLTMAVDKLSKQNSLTNSYLLRMFSAQHSVIEALRRNNPPARNMYVQDFRNQLTVLETEVRENT